jgi:hemerythrin-like domain-containing protein
MRLSVIQHSVLKVERRRIVGSLKNVSERAQLVDSMQELIRMYNPHETREDTVLFPAFRKIVSAHEFDSLGEDFEKEENEQGWI